MSAVAESLWFFFLLCFFSLCVWEGGGGEELFSSFFLFFFVFCSLLLLVCRRQSWSLPFGDRHLREPLSLWTAPDFRAWEALQGLTPHHSFKQSFCGGGEVRANRSHTPAVTTHRRVTSEKFAAALAVALAPAFCCLSFCLSRFSAVCCCCFCRVC